MSLCINPDCPQPSHSDNSHSTTCQECGSQLLLQGRYRVMRLLSNKTGFGMVYEAYERDEPKILKVLKRDRSEHPKVLYLFQKEAEVLSQLRHPGVPFIAKDGYFTYLPAATEIPLHCIIMEKIDGPNLQQWMQQQGNHPIGEHQAFQWLMQLVDILRRVHQHNYFHRDIKPDNIMLRSSGQLVLVDFGAAREMTQTYLAQIGSLGVTTVSSAGYTPPEQEQGQAVPQSDFFALGRTLIYLLTGLSPNDTALYDPMLNTFNWRLKAPQISDELANILNLLIAPRVVDRPKTAQEIMDRLHQLAVGQPMLATDAQTQFPETSLPGEVERLTGQQSPRTGDTQVQRERKTRLQGNPDQITGWTWLIAGGVTIAALGLLGIGLWGQRSSAPVAMEETSQANAPVPLTPLQEFAGHSSSINALYLLSDKQRFISASADTTMRLWDLTTGEVLQTYDAHDAFVNAIALSPDEKSLYSGSADGTIYRWNLETGEKQAEFIGHGSPVNALVRTSDGKQLVSGAADGSLVLWDIPTQIILTTIEAHEGAINALTLTRDGQRVISGGADLVLKVWDRSSGRLTQTLVGHESFVNAIAVSPDGQSVFSASADETVRQWSLKTGELLATMTGHESYVNVLTLSPDGRQISSGSADGIIQVWDIKTNELFKTYTAIDMPIDHLLEPAADQIITATKAQPTIKAWTIAPEQSQLFTKPDY